MIRRMNVFIIICLLACPLQLEAEEMPLFDKDAFVASAGVKKVLKLAMVDCVAMALKSNSEIQVKKISPLIEDANVMIQRAKFEPALSFEYKWEDNVDLSSNTLFGTKTNKTRNRTFNFGYDQKLVTGTQLDVNFYNTRTVSSSVTQSFNPEFNSEAEITVTQPLLKGAGIIVNKADFLIAKNNKLKSKQEFAQEVMSILTSVKNGYYDFQYSQEQYRVAQVSLKRVQGLYDINKEKYAKGLASSVDLLESESESARFEQAILAAEEVMRLAEDNLKFITNLVDDASLWNADVILLDEIKYEKKETDLADAIKTAFDHRPDYEAGKLDLANKGLSVIFYRNGMLPIVDLVGSYGLNGLGKTYEKDLGHIGGGHYPDWFFGVNAKLPLGSQEEKGMYEKAKLEKKQALINFKRLEQKIILEVRDAVRNLDLNYRILEASIKSKDTETKNYEAQETRFRAGLVSTHDIVSYQERLARAEIDYVKRAINYNMSLIELARAEGMTLINDNIKIDE